MNASTLILAPLALASGLACAAHATPADIAAETGLTPREVSMVLGSSTGYAEFVTGYERAYARLHRALGDERMARLLAANGIAPRGSLQARANALRADRDS